MAFSGGFDDCRAAAEFALRKMAEFDIRPAPENFEIWFEYATGRNPDLNRTLDILLSNSAEFSESRCREIYHQFFTPGYDDREIAGTARAVQKQVRKILDFIEQISAESGNYGDSLKSFSTELLGEMSLEDIRHLLDGVIERTEEMHASNCRLKGELEKSTHEIETLRENLVSAQKETLTDGLTGLINRRGFDMKLRETAMTAMETGAELSLVMADIDHFKLFNDEWGHLLGDQILKLVAQTMRKSLDQRTMIARFGGEEFAVLLPGYDLKGAAIQAEAMRREICNRVARKKDTGDSVGRITCSFGIASFRKGEPLAEFIKRADDALYLAKDRGRNCVADESGLPELTAHAQPMA